MERTAGSRARCSIQRVTATQSEMTFAFALERATVAAPLLVVGAEYDGSITVLGPLERIELGPATATSVVGAERFYSARGFFAGGTEDNLTQDAAYSSSNPEVAVATNEPGKKSKVVAVGVGTTTIRATVGGVVSNDATLTVVAP